MLGASDSDFSKGPRAFNDVTDIHMLFPCKPTGRQDFIHSLPRPANEWSSPQVFILPGGLSNDQNIRMRITLTKDYMVLASCQSAFVAAKDFRLKCLHMHFQKKFG